MADHITSSWNRPSSPANSTRGNADSSHGLDTLSTQGLAVGHHQGDGNGGLFLLFLYAFYERLNAVENTFTSIAPRNPPDRFRIAEPPLRLPPAVSRALDATTSTVHREDLAPPRGGRIMRVNAPDDAPPSYALSIDETTWGFLTDLLELRISMAVYSSNADGVDAPTTIIDEHALCALLMHAIMWYIDRECISLTGVQVAFIGRRVGEEVNAQYPCLPIDDIRDIAEQLPLDDISAIDQADFDPYMFCAGEFFPSICGYRYLLFLVALYLLISTIFGYLIARVFGTLLPIIIFILGDARVKFVFKFMFKLLDALDALEGYVLHIGAVIFGFVEFTIHYGN